MSNFTKIRQVRAELMNADRDMTKLTGAFRGLCGHATKGAACVGFELDVRLQLLQEYLVTATCYSINQDHKCCTAWHGSLHRLYQGVLTFGLSHDITVNVIWFMPMKEVQPSHCRFSRNWPVVSSTMLRSWYRTLPVWGWECGFPSAQQFEGLDHRAVYVGSPWKAHHRLRLADTLIRKSVFFFFKFIC